MFKFSLRGVFFVLAIAAVPLGWVSSCFRRCSALAELPRSVDQDLTGTDISLVTPGGIFEMGDLQEYQNSDWKLWLISKPKLQHLIITGPTWKRARVRCRDWGVEFLSISPSCALPASALRDLLDGSAVTDLNFSWVELDSDAVDVIIHCPTIKEISLREEVTISDQDIGRLKRSRKWAYWECYQEALRDKRSRGRVP
jgi:hypothetical protein